MACQDWGENGYAKVCFPTAERHWEGLSEEVHPFIVFFHLQMPSSQVVSFPSYWCYFCPNENSSGLSATFSRSSSARAARAFCSQSLELSSWAGESRTAAHGIRFAFAGTPVNPKAGDIVHSGRP